MRITSAAIKKELRGSGNKAIADHSQRFFKTGKGDYAEGDKFLGIRVPVIRKLVKKYRTTSLTEVLKILPSGYHEERLFAVLMLVELFSKGDEEAKLAIYRTYLENTRFINNWDLVDASAHKIVGAYLEKRNKQILYELAESDNLWERRISMITTYWFIKRDRFEDALKISGLLVNDKEDLIHKAVGWMLREIGKRDLDSERKFLQKHYKKMPRTMLRYAIEKFPEDERKAYLKGLV